MIAKSDLIILVLSASALAVGVYRWQQNTRVNVAALTRVPAVTVESEPPVLGTGNADIRTVDTVLPTVRRIVSVDASEAPAALDVRANAEPDPTIAATSTASPVQSGQPLYGVYQVRSGDYLGVIAERVGTSVEMLQEINDITGTTIQIGQRIRYPQAAN